MKSFFFYILVMLPCLGFAQFNGNNGDGFDESDAAGFQLDGQIVSTVALYQGGEGDGFSLFIAQSNISGQPIMIYTGGRGDGFSQHIQAANLLEVDIESIYSGGDGDGFSVNLTNALLNGSSLLIYEGGTGDGFSIDLKDQLLLTGFMTMLYEGGDGDGFSEMQANELFLTGLINDLFNGGDGDGFATRLSDPGSLSGELFNAFGGGDGDGFATNELEGFIFEVLPVEWISFEAVKQESTVLLLWSTASETNNDRFEVERSLDGLQFSKIDQVDGAGTVDTQQDYEALDEEPVTGVNYYRIKQVDFDGNFSFTDIKSVLFEEEGFQVKLYPNPNRQRILNIDISGLGRKDQVQMRVVNVNGQVLMDEEVNANSTVDLSWDWPAGNYWIQLIAGEKQVTRSLVIVD